MKDQDELLRALAVKNHIVKQVTLDDTSWDEVALLRRQTHYSDCWSHLSGLLSEDEYSVALLDQHIDPARLGPKRASETGSELYAWYCKDVLVAWASFALLDLMPTSIACLSVMRLYIEAKPDKTFVSGLIEAFRSYAKAQNCALVHFNLLPHNQPVLDELITSGASVRNVEVDWLL